MTYSLEVSSRQPSGAGVTSFPLRITAGDQAVTNQGNNTATLIGLSTENGGGSSRIKCAIGHCRTESADRGSIVFLCNNVNDSNPVTMSDERMRITSTGNVGIGTATVNAKLHITHSSTNLSDPAAGGAGIYLHNPTNSSGNNSVMVNRIAGSSSGKIIYAMDVDANYGCSMYMQGNQNRMKFNNAWHSLGTDMAYFECSTNQFWCYGPSSLSDRRIKRDIEDINDDDALNKILLIQPTTYYYRDESRNRGNGKVYGFIAQQIKDVIPDAVRTTSDIIANIYKTCLISNKRNVYHNIPLDVPIDTEIRILENENGKGAIYKIKEIYEDYFVIDNDIDTDEAFVYGYNVNDLNGLDKSYIFTLNVCATQELHRRIEAQSVVIKSYEDRIKDLETKVERLINSMNA